MAICKIKQNNEWIRKRVQSLKGQKRTPEQRKKMSDAQKKRFARTGSTSGCFVKGRILSQEE